MVKVVECARELPALVDAVIDGRADDLAASQLKIAALESEADAIKNDLRSHLPRRLFLSVDRRDLLELLDMQDTIADSAEDVGDMLVVRPWVIPERLRQPLRDLTAAALECVNRAGLVLGRMDDLSSAAFAGPEVVRTIALIEEVHRLEEVADEAEVVLQRLVFDEEEALGPIGVMMWLRLLEVMGDVADYAKKACNRLRLLIAS